MSKEQQLILAGDPGRVYDIKSFDALNSDAENLIVSDVCHDVGIGEMLICYDRLLVCYEGFDLTNVES